jgi:hypothetical protein
MRREPAVLAEFLTEVRVKRLEVAALVAAARDLAGRRKEICCDAKSRQLEHRLLELVLTVARGQVRDGEAQLGNELVALSAAFCHATKVGI